MKHLVWGILSLLIGTFLLVGALVLAHVSVGTNLIYGGIFIAYGVYRLNQHSNAKKQKANRS